MTTLSDIPRIRRVPQQARSRERLQRVLDAADRVVAEEGAEALTTTRVAEAAGVSVGSIYQYLPDKAAIVEALAKRHLDDFTELMQRFVAEARSHPERLDDPVGAMVDTFAQRYREQPGYRALWFGRELTEELRAADRVQKEQLASALRRVLNALGLVRDGARLAVQTRAGVLVADALLQAAFRADERGDRKLIEEAKRILRLYLADVAREHAERRRELS